MKPSGPYSSPGSILSLIYLTENQNSNPESILPLPVSSKPLPGSLTMKMLTLQHHLCALLLRPLSQNTSWLSLKLEHTQLSALVTPAPSAFTLCSEQSTVLVAKHGIWHPQLHLLIHNVPRLRCPIPCQKVSWQLSTPQHPCSHIAADFITDIPGSNHNMVIMVNIDIQYSQILSLVPLLGLPSAFEIAELIFNYVLHPYW